MSGITVVGGGLAGLVAGIACAEAGVAVTLHEGHGVLGGRARATESPCVAHDGPHVFYCDGPHWTWFTERGLMPPAAKYPLAEATRFRLRIDGRSRAIPPLGLLRLAAQRSRRAPVDQDFFGWVAASHGARVARLAANLLGVVTYDHDPGRLSAAFAWDIVRRVLAPRTPAVRYVIGGWPALIRRLESRARELGVRIETNSRITELPSTPVIVATQLESARQLLGDDSLRWESGRCVLLDVAVRGRRGDAMAVLDLDEAGFLERFSGPDPSLAPAGESLIQADMPIRPGESTADARTRVERLIDLGAPGWRDRTTWRRDGLANGRSGALDLPGRTWRDRPAIDRGDDVFLAGDMVAAPGMRGEISINSAINAAELAVRAVTRVSSGAAGCG